MYKSNLHFVYAYDLWLTAHPLLWNILLVRKQCAVIDILLRNVHNFGYIWSELPLYVYFSHWLNIMYALFWQIHAVGSVMLQFETEHSGMFSPCPLNRIHTLWYEVVPKILTDIVNYAIVKSLCPCVMYVMRKLTLHGKVCPFLLLKVTFLDIAIK